MKHRITALLLAFVLFVFALPAAYAVEYTPQDQLYILLDVQDLIREKGLESSFEDQPLERALKAVLKATPEELDNIVDQLQARGLKASASY